jgi:hypothetical protein
MEMTKSEAARERGNDSIVFPVNRNQEFNKVVVSEEPIENSVVENRLEKSNPTMRFARLKKSLRKRSVSIL